jgi:uncharacterized membrane protein (UPF0127 family)
MKLYPLNIKDEIFNVAVADTPETQAQGLSGLPRLGKRKGMLFVFQEPIRVHMVMRDMNFDLDFLFLDENWTIIQLQSLAKEDKFGVTANKPVSMVLELPYGTIKNLNLKIGDIITPEENLQVQYEGVKQFKRGGTFEKIGEKIYDIKIDDVNPEEGKLQILNNEGEVVANVEPNATIFSQKHTKDLIKIFKSGDKKKLADAFIIIKEEHDKQKPDYVKKD